MDPQKNQRSSERCEKKNQNLSVNYKLTVCL